MAKKQTQKNSSTSNGNGRAQIFSFRSSGASNVQLVGDFTQWQEKPIQLKKEPTGVWRTSVELTPGTHRYRFIVDGQWCDDPTCAMHEPNPYGTQDSVLQVQ